MLDSLKYVKGAIGKRDIVPALTHFKIKDGRITSFNGQIALSAPINLQINCAPKAAAFIKAIQSCEDSATSDGSPAISFKLTANNKLTVKCEKFKTQIDCTDEIPQHVDPDGSMFAVNGEALLKAFQTLCDFIGDDASRPWCTGILLNEYSAYATNNVILMEYWIGTLFPMPCNIPKSAIKEVVRIGAAPKYGQITPTSLTLHYDDGKWLRTSLLSVDWPTAVATILNSAANPSALPDDFFKGLTAIRPFSDSHNRVHITSNLLATSPEAIEGASFETQTVSVKSTYSIDRLLSVQHVIKTIDLTRYPQPAIFFGDCVRGAVTGMRGV